MQIQILLTALFFTAIGAFSFIWPHRVFAQFGVAIETAEGRNEVRGIYGGMCIAIGGLLFLTPWLGTFAGGAILAVAVALSGMAGGRIASLLLERTAKAPLIYLLLEAGFATLLFSAITLS